MTPSLSTKVRSNTPSTAILADNESRVVFVSTDSDAASLRTPHGGIGKTECRALSALPKKLGQNGTAVQKPTAPQSFDRANGDLQERKPEPFKPKLHVCH